MELNQITGIGLFVAGIVLLSLAYDAAAVPLEENTYHYSNETMLYYTSGVGAVIGGGLRSLFGLKK
ncbi:MAG: hypothetical protein ABL951_10825 [Alphaproteobacteria bacterium]